MSTPRDRRGVALVAALLLVSFIALLITGSLSASTIADRAAALAQVDARLMNAADFVIHAPLASPNGFGLAKLPLGVATPLSVTSPDGDVDAHVSATRLPRGVIWLVADVAVPRVDEARRRVNLVASYATVMSLPTAPIVSHGDVRVGTDGTFTVDSTGDVDCRGMPQAFAMLAPGANATNVAQSITDARAADSATYGLLASQLSALHGPGVVHTLGDTTISGTFSGLLIVEGNLTLSGSFTATGLVIARGRVDAGLHHFAIRGAVLSFATPLSQPAMDLGDASIEFAPCVIQETVWNVSILSAVKYRSWQEMF